jgi:hypothetical protein
MMIWVTHKRDEQDEYIVRFAIALADDSAPDYGSINRRRREQHQYCDGR